MKPSKRMVFASIPENLIGLIAKEFPDDRAAYHLFDEFLQKTAYDRAFAVKLIAKARPGAGTSWETRRLAVLMLENQVLKIPPAAIDEFDFFFVDLKIKGGDTRLNESLLKEGYSTIDLASFIPQFRGRLQRFERVHRGMRGSETSRTALRDFIDLSRRECKLSLARYLFQPTEVVDRVLSQLKLSRGVPDIDPSMPDYVEAQIQHVRNRLPEFEASILDQLSRTSYIYWVSESTSAEINSLVEYPLTTVVLVVKPPGSHIEFEIKRAGRRGPSPLNVVYYRGGWRVPPAHQLDGGSMQWLLRHEATVCARLASIYRIVHNAEPPVSTIVSRSAVYGVPSAGSVEHIVDYFTNPECFPGGFGQMREAMRQLVGTEKPKDGWDPLGEVGDLGVTVKFLKHVTPGQGILCGTTSLRLDKLAAYLSADGPEIYFKTGLRTGYSRKDAKRLADEVLDEVLGVYEPPAADYRNHRQYVEQALNVPANRERASRNYLQIVDQIGKFWGTLLGVRGYTWGESFVGRNVGLRSEWDRGEWRVKMIFMDHDNLNLPDSFCENFPPDEAFPGFRTDALYVGAGLVGATPGQNEIELLRDIYRVEDKVANRGKRLLFSSMKKAYRKTHRRIKVDTRLRRFFHEIFITRIRDWDILANGFLAIDGNEARSEKWKAETNQALMERGYSPNLAKRHLVTLEKFRDFIQETSFLYDPSYSLLSRS